MRAAEQAQTNPALCSLLSALCSLLSALCSLLSALCSLLPAPCYRPRAASASGRPRRTSVQEAPHATPDQLFLGRPRLLAGGGDGVGAAQHGHLAVLQRLGVPLLLAGGRRARHLLLVDRKSTRLNSSH